jgi:hypothetical protein
MSFKYDALLHECFDRDGGIGTSDATIRMWYRWRKFSDHIIRSCLGEDWYTANISRFEKRPDYFGTTENDADSYARFFSRLIELAELIINLQTVENFDAVVMQFQSDVRSVETRIGELMGGRFFKYLGVSFNYRMPIGVKQADYDIDYVRLDGQTGRCEVKTKLQGTKLSEETIKNTLTEAKKQLPKGKTSIVLLRIPEVWMAYANFEAELLTVRKAVSDWLRKEKTSRISSVFIVECRTDVIHNQVHNYWYPIECKNPFCKDVTGLPEVVTYVRHSTIPVDNWIRLPSIVDKWFE